MTLVNLVNWSLLLDMYYYSFITGFFTARNTSKEKALRILTIGNWLCTLWLPTWSQLRIAVEAEAILGILLLSETEIELISSDVLLFEVKRIPSVHRKKYVIEVLEESNVFIEINDRIENRATTLNTKGIKSLDALHLACAEAAKADYFCTCDDKFLKKAKILQDIKTKAVSPL
jgi:predicted nucleic acid-binding protein